MPPLCHSPGRVPISSVLLVSLMARWHLLFCIACTSDRDGSCCTESSLTCPHCDFHLARLCSHRQHSLINTLLPAGFPHHAHLPHNLWWTMAPITPDTSPSLDWQESHPRVTGAWWVIVTCNTALLSCSFLRLQMPASLATRRLDLETRGNWTTRERIDSQCELIRHPVHS